MRGMVSTPLALLLVLSSCSTISSPTTRLHAAGSTATTGANAYGRLAASSRKVTVPRQRINPAPGHIHAGNTSKVPIAVGSLKENTDPLLQNISERDMVRIQAEAKRIYAKLWPVFAERSRYVRSRILPIIKRLHAPSSLDILPIVESGYNPYALSSAGAMGLWQLMPGTARMLDVRAPYGINGRRDVERGTEGAVRYLLAMRARFGNWPLAFAAYHRGPGSIARALRRHPWKPSDGLDRLPVPTITRTYVRSILGLVALLQHGVWHFPDPWPMRALTLQAPVDINLLVRATGISRNDLFRFNPGLDHSQYLDSPVTLYAPDRMHARMLASASKAIPAHIRIRIRPGDNLWTLARKYHTTLRHLRQMNPHASGLLRPGWSLRVPARRFNAAYPSPNPLLAKGRRIRYRIRGGDNLWNIAKRFGTTPRAIARTNSLRQTSMLHPGDRLWILAHIRPS